jgi:hypothetical protein
MSATTRYCACQACGAPKHCERVYDKLLGRHFWLCAACVIGWLRTEAP